ncbi:MAG: hypothetical protein QW215_02365 [Ignisphaera sp.]
MIQIIEDIDIDELPRRKRVKICHVKDMWYIFIPKFIEYMLLRKGIGVGDECVWEIVHETDDELIARVVFRKRKKEISK